MKSIFLRKPYHFAFLLCLALTALTSCSDEMDGYVKTVQSGIKIYSWPKQMESLYGDGDHFITEYGFSSKPRQWNTEVWFYGRYTLTLQFDVSINYHKHTVEEIVSRPKFYLDEVKSIDESGGRQVTSFSGQWVFDETQWNKLVQAKGDWSVLGIPVKTNSPVAGFDKYVKGLREPRVRIPH